MYTKFLALFLVIIPMHGAVSMVKEELSSPTERIINCYLKDDGLCSAVQIMVYYPQIRNPNKYEKQFNDVVDEYIRQQLDIFMTRVQEDASEHDAGRAILTISYTLFFFSDSFISVRIRREVDCGWFHPLTSYASINYDCATGTMLDLRDIIKKDKKAKTYLIEQSIGRLIAVLQQNCVPEHDCSYDVAAGVHKRFEAWPSSLCYTLSNCWNITPLELLLTFNEYEVGSYSMGISEIVIPYHEQLINDYGKKIIGQKSVVPYHAWGDRSLIE